MERRLSVDHYVLAARQVDEQVWPQRGFRAREGRLLAEVAVAKHAGELDDVSQLHLAPLPARVRLAQRSDQRTCLAAQPLARLVQVAQLRLEAAARFASLLVEAKQLGVDPSELLAQWRDQLLDRLVALLQVALRLRLRRLKLRPGQLGQLGHARLQRLGAQRLERRR